MSEKDKADLRWALRTGADLIALSFVRSPAAMRYRAMSHNTGLSEAGRVGSGSSYRAPR